MPEQTDPEFQYAFKILSAIQSCFESDSDNYIDRKELTEGDNLTHFFHALANIAPTRIFNQITGEDKTTLEFNHIANQLCFQYSTVTKDSTPDE